MTTRYINVTLGTKSKVDNTYSVTVNHGTAVTGHLTVAYDDTQITTVDQMVQAFRYAQQHALSNAKLTY